MPAIPRKKLPEPEEVPAEARHAARGLKKWLQERRERGVPENGWVMNSLKSCDESCTLHDHKR